MSPAAELVLRDIHDTPAPPWWPPAPGWWLLLAVLSLGLLAFGAWRWRRARRRARARRLFDSTVAAAASPAAKVAAISALLRRAAKRRDAGADTLQGEAWLALLDAGLPRADFREGAGRLLVDGGFRRDVPEAEAEALRVVARARFLAWMDGAR